MRRKRKNHSVLTAPLTSARHWLKFGLVTINEKNSIMFGGLVPIMFPTFGDKRFSNYSQSVRSELVYFLFNTFYFIFLSIFYFYIFQKFTCVVPNFIHSRQEKSAMAGRSLLLRIATDV